MRILPLVIFGIVALAVLALLRPRAGAAAMGGDVSVVSTPSVLGFPTPGAQFDSLFPKRTGFVL